MLSKKYVTARKLEKEGTPSALFVIKTPRYDCRSVSPTYFIYVTFK